MVELIHTSDWHLGNPFSAFSETQQQALASARFDAVTRLFTVAREAGVRLLLCAGDQIDNGELRDARVLLRLFGIIASFPEVQVVMIAGNHDPLTPGSVYRRVEPTSYPKNLLFVTEPRVVDLPDHGVRILAAPLSARSGTTNPIVELAARAGAGGTGGAGTEAARRADETGPALAASPVPAPAGTERPVTVGLAHGSLALSETVGGGSDAFPIPPELAEAAGLDYLALGDWHSYLKVGSRTCYPGTHEPLAFGDDAGSLHVTIEGPGEAPVVRRLEESAFTWREVRRTLADETLDGLLGELAEAAQSGEADRLLLRLILDGYLSLERFKQLEERLAIAETQLFGLSVDHLPSVRPGEAEIREVASEGYMGKVVDRLLELAAAGDAAAEGALLRVHEFFRAEPEGRNR